MIPRILLNNIQYVKKFVLVSLCFYLVEHIPFVERILEIEHKIDNESVFTTEAIKSSVEMRDVSENIERTRMNVVEESKLILVWTEYQMIGKDIYSTIFSRISNNECPVSNCRFTTDRSLINQSEAVIFHMPNLHWENYTYPQYRDPSKPWIFMTYESATNVRQRSSNWGRYPPINWHKINHVFNRTMTFRKDSDVTVRHGYVEKRKTPLTDSELSQLYSQEPLADFSNYTYLHYRDYGNITQAPIAWFVSHCNAHSGRDKYIQWLRRWIGVDVYGKCGNKKCGEVKNIQHKYSPGQDHCFNMVNKKYRFYISFENAICKDYITEKTFNALKLNTIPIVLGGVNYTSVLPPGSFINAAEFVSPQGLANYLYKLLQNNDLFMKYFHWRRHYNVYSFTSVPDPCDLCAKVQSEEWKKPKVYHHMYEWFIQGSRCIFTNYKTPFFALYQLLGAGIFHKKVRESIALVADTNNPYKPIILVNFTRIAQPREFGVKFVTKKAKNGPSKDTNNHGE